jgi:hypothetical protein
MRRVVLIAAVALAGCGHKHAALPPTPAKPPHAAAPWTVLALAVNASEDDVTGFAAGPRGGLVAVQEGDCRVRVAGGSRSRALPGRLIDGPVSAGDHFAAVLGGCTGGAELDELAPDGRTLSRIRLPLRGDGPVAIAAGPGPALGVAWGQGPRLWALARAPSGMLGQPMELARSSYGIESLAAVFLPTGRLLVAFSDFGHVRAVILGDRARPRTLGPASDVSHLVAGVAGHRTIIAWGTLDGGEERNTPYKLYAAIGDRTRLLDTAPAIDDMQATDDPQTYPQLAVAPDGRALLAWGSVTGKDFGRHSFPVRYAEAAPGHAFAKPRTLVRDGTVGGVALDQDHALIAFQSGPRVWAAIDGRAELVADREPLPSPPSASFTGGRARLSWFAFGGARPSLRLAERVL